MNIFGRQFRFADILAKNKLISGGIVDQSPQATVAANALVPSKDRTPPNPNDPAVGIYSDKAVSLFLEMLTRIPDPDEVLRAAGLTRAKLRVMMTDDEIYQAMDTRRDAAMGMPLRIEPGAEEDETAMFLVTELVKHQANIVAGAWEATPYGYSVLEAVYDEIPRPNGKIGFHHVGSKPFEWFEPKNDGRLMYYPDDGSGGWYGMEVDQTFKFFCTQRRPTYKNPYGEALLSRLYWAWFFRTNGWKFWAKFMERFGSPLLVGMSSDPVAMVNSLLRAHSQAVVGVGPDDKVEAVGAPSAGQGGDAFDRFESASIRRIQKVVLGQTLTSGTDGGSGNRALGQVHDAVRKDKKESDLALITPTVQRLCDALCVLNKIPLGKYKVFFSDETGLETERAERDKNLVSTGQLRFTEQYFLANYDFREGDIIVKEEFDPIPGFDKDGNPLPPAAKPGALPAPKPGAKKVKAEDLYREFARHGRGTRFTRQQEMLEDLADEALAEAGKPLAADLIRACVFAASDPEDLEERLLALIGQDTLSEEMFTQVMEKALFTADVLGYVHADGKV